MLTCQLPPGDLSLIDDQLFVLMIHLIFGRSIDQLKSRRVRCQPAVVYSKLSKNPNFKKRLNHPGSSSDLEVPRSSVATFSKKCEIVKRRKRGKQTRDRYLSCLHRKQPSAIISIFSASCSYWTTRMGILFLFWGKMLPQSIWAMQRYSNNN